MSAPLRVLIVEDEALVAMMVEDAVIGAGHEVVRVATNIRDALAAAASDEFDVAILDMNLHGQKAHAVPVILENRGKRFMFATGYGEAGVLDRFAHAPVVAKPFRAEEIVLALEVLAAAPLRPC